MIFINPTISVKRERTGQGLTLLDGITQATRNEPGNIFFEWSKSIDNPHQFVLIEAFQDAEAGAAHVNSDHFRAAMALLPEVIAETPEIINVEVPGNSWAKMAELTPSQP